MENKTTLSLHSFCLPQQLIQAIHFNPNPSFKLLPTQQQQQQQHSSHPPILNNANLSCTICQSHFESNELQRQHFRSDWHRFNLKLTSLHPPKPPISHDDFLISLESLQDSLSGSEDSDSNHSSDDQDESNLSNHHGIRTHKFNQLFTHNNHTSNVIESSSVIEEDPVFNSINLLIPTSPIVWFDVPASSLSTALISNQPSPSQEEETIIQLGFYRCIFPKTYLLEDKSLQNSQQDQLGEQYITELSQLQHDFLPLNFSINHDHSFVPNENLLLSPNQVFPPIWTFLMVGGGHFAAMVVSVIPKSRHVGKHKPPEIEPVILLHKSFHRYTTRRKQGGGQASHDAGGKGAAKSAGANLRRYNEQALSEDIQNLLNSWSDKIQKSDLIFIRSSKSNLKLFFKNHNNQENEDVHHFKLNRGDDRIRSFPFVTRRPTFNELKRCFNELTRAKVIKTTKQEILEKELEWKTMYEKEKTKREMQIRKKLEQQERIRLEEEKKKKDKIPKEKTVEEKEKEMEISRWERIIDLVRKGKLEQIQEFIKKYDQIKWLEMIPSMIIEESDLTHGCVSLLQIASMSDQAEVVEWMLTEGKSDPTMRNTKLGTKGSLTAYELACSKNTRNAFRRVMAKEPDRCNWIQDARVPSALTEQLENNQAVKNKEWKNKMKEKMREREKLKLIHQEKNQLELQDDNLKIKKNQVDHVDIETKKINLNSNVNRLSSSNSNNRITSHLNSSLIGLSDLQQARLERERRARAAEARLVKK